MNPEFTQAAIIAAIAIAVAILVLWFVLRLNTKTEIVDTEETKDVLDDGAAPAQRNQALIDAAPAAATKAFGETSARANADQIAAATAIADAEAGASVTSGAPETPAPEPAKPGPAPVPKTVNDGVSQDDLTQIKGLGPKLAATLREMGITTFAEIAAWSDADVERIDSQLGRFAGRITRDQWVEQAKLLISEDKAAFEAKFGNNR